MAKQVAIILSGCGHLDGSEIREAVLTLLSLEKLGIAYQCFAPDIEFNVTDHFSAQDQPQKRSVISEAARIARGNIKNLDELKVENFAAVILPGGYGAAKNLSDLASKGADAIVIPQLQSLLVNFWKTKKIIAAICISPALVVAALSQYTSISVTIGNDTDNLINKLGGKHIICAADNYYHDKENNILSTPAYMLDAKLNDIAVGIELMIQKLSSEG